MAISNRPKLSEMSLTALRKYANQDLGLKGLSKSDRETVTAAILGVWKAAQSAPKQLRNGARQANYSRQRFGKDTSRLFHTEYNTPRQKRRIRKNANKALRKAA